MIRSGICLLLVVGLASALVVKMETPELVDRADQIVTGRVLDVRSEWNDSRDYIFSYITVRVDEYVKGTGGRDVVVKIPGGAIGDIQLRVSDIPDFAEGETVVLFLTDDYPEHSNLLGLFQGKYTAVEGRLLENGADLGEFLNEIRYHLR
jgi:hypothetical protein